MDTTAYIKKELGSRLKNKKTNVVRPRIQALDIVPEKERGTFMQKFLGICIFFMFVATLFILIAKGLGIDVKQLTFLTSETKASEVVIKERPIIDPDLMSRTQAESKLSSFDVRLRAVEQSHDVWKHRIWLLGLALNENANLNKIVDQKYHGNIDNGYIVFDQQWKMNAIPRTMELTPEQKETLQNKDLK